MCREAQRRVESSRVIRVEPLSCVVVVARTKDRSSSIKITVLFAAGETDGRTDGRTGGVVRRSFQRPTPAASKSQLRPRSKQPVQPVQPVQPASSLGAATTITQKVSAFRLLCRRYRIFIIIIIEP